MTSEAPKALRRSSLREARELPVSEDVAAVTGGHDEHESALDPRSGSSARSSTTRTATTTIFVEDAISGVQAGRDGGFGLVIGVARKDNAEALAGHGADVVVADLAELLS